MGNSNAKESRQGSGAEDPRQRRHTVGDSTVPRSRISRSELGFLSNLASNSAAARDRDRTDAPFERRETRQEREARRLEKERAARAKERERSVREEHVDGGYVVTMGTYTGTEDFSKQVVRQLQIERKMAPFWRGLNDWSSSWAEHQLVAAARGLPIPAADAPPDPDLIPQPLPPTNSSAPDLQSLTVPMGPRTLSAASDRSGSGTGTGSALPSPVSAGPTKSTSFKPRAKALAAALSVGSRNTSSTELVPKEITLPRDPFVNGQPIEVYLYKDATECPICFLSYPPYLNSTRCCDQAICSECFVQIKRADPHLPEHHPDGQARDPNEGLSPEEPPERLISVPSACPYCQQPEFGVTYEPPPFKRGLTYSSSSTLPSATAMSSQSSLNSTLSPNFNQQPNRRRTHSLSANAPNVITTDRVRPDWATKLASARSHQARRAAAATALHTAAFLVGGADQRSLLRNTGFGRRNTGTNSAGTGTPGGGQASGDADAGDGNSLAERASSNLNADGSRRSRMDELEDMMFMEAVRLSLAAEEERKRKEEKALRKDAKKREQAERKALKKQGKDPYGGGGSSASGSSLSLGLGRLRGNSTASNLRVEATLQGASQASRLDETSSADREQREQPGGKQDDARAKDKGKAVDRGSSRESLGEEASSSGAMAMPTGSSRGGSHLRQMSNASSLGSSLADTPSGSYTGQGFMGPDGNRDPERDAGSEPLFNFRSLAELVGVNIEDGTSQQQDEGEGEIPGTRPLSQVKEDVKEEADAEHVEEKTLMKDPAAEQKSLKPEDATGPRGGGEQSELPTPELTITPETPAPVDDDAAESKQLGHSSVAEQTPQVTQ